MSDHRFHKSIAERSDIVVSRVVDPLRRRRRILTWTCCAASLLGSAVLLLGKPSRFEARPVARAHQLFEQDCARCHQQAFATVDRLMSLSNVPSVNDAACLDCHHDKQRPDHHADRLSDSGRQIGETTNCAECHQEHSGANSLARVDDAFCTKCHADLNGFAAPPNSEREPVQMQVASWSGHPAIGAHRRTDQLTPGLQGPPPNRIKFNHRLHLHPEGMPTSDAGRVERLDCASCHQLDASGEYMRPIAFEQHCSRCHTLDVFTQMQIADLPGDVRSPLPHQAPELIRGVIRGRLMASLKASSAGTGVVPHADPLALPDQPPSPADSAWVDDMLARVERQLFESPQPRDSARAPEYRPSIAMICGVCHEFESADSLQVVTPRIPSRWMTRARFPHDRHADVRCIDCHFYQRNPEGGGYRAPVASSVPGLEPAELQAAYHDLQPPAPNPRNALDLSIYASTAASDVLLPDIDVCQKCHGDVRTDVATGGAPFACTDCHDYHDDLMPAHSETVVDDPAATAPQTHDDKPRRRPGNLRTQQNLQFLDVHHSHDQPRQHP